MNAAPSPVERPLRPYQLDAIRDVFARMREGQRRVVLVLPTGTGKTRTAAEVVRRAVAKSKRVLWLGHRTELLDQTCGTLIEYGLRVGVIAARSCFDADRDAPVQVASIQTLLAREVRPPADLIVWDECHHASEAAEEWSSLLDAYPGVHMLGLTATPERGDGSGLAPIFTGLVVGISVRKATEQGYLVPCEVVHPERLLASGHLSQSPLDAYKEHSPGQQALLFAKSVEEAQKFAAEFTAAGIRTVCVHAKTPDLERAAAVAAFKAGTVRVLSNVYVFTEGTDLTMASACILARGASTAGTYLQMVGRILRPHPGKRKATLIDLRGVSRPEVHGPPEDDRIFKLEGRGISKAQSKCKVCGCIITAYPCAECGYEPLAGDVDEASQIDNVRMIKFARKIAESRSQRWETCVRWVRAAVAKEWKIVSVRHKWRAVYGEDLPLSWLRAAEEIVCHGVVDDGAPS